jgi:hypothetical protein
MGYWFPYCGEGRAQSDIERAYFIEDRKDVLDDGHAVRS